MADRNIATGESIALAWYVQVVSSFCTIDEDSMMSNLKAVDNTWLPSEKIVSLDLMKFVSNNFGAIITCLIYDFENIRQLFVDALNLEFQINEMSRDDRKSQRKKMRTGMTADKHFIELNVTTFSFSTIETMLNACAANIKVYNDSELTKDLDTVVENMNDRDKVMLGIILSNYAYLVRAFCNNYEFRMAVEKIVNTVNDRL